MKSKFGHQHTVATLATGIGGSIYELTCITDLSPYGKIKTRNSKAKQLGWVFLPTWKIYLTVHTCDVVGLPESGWSVLNLSASRLFSLQKVATQFTSCSPNRSHCLSETPSTIKSASMVDGLQSSQSLTIQFPQQKQYLFNPQKRFYQQHTDTLQICIIFSSYKFLVLLKVIYLYFAISKRILLVAIM